MDGARVLDWTTKIKKELIVIGRAIMADQLDGAGHGLAGSMHAEDIDFSCGRSVLYQSTAANRLVKGQVNRWLVLL